ncbi:MULTISPECIES: hypothetical protein [unclassified Streptomyces]|uniref:hypothetical protein n=1 Tax=unclassified Streptomyces TaxID=2593676 RepID=UPI002DD855DF|nr:MULTISPECIES: hypothetical protein [unclassified Streptomyces]WSA95168.1 hypothetical protein OIE63_29155 [Streptomyces sp. NBC_01795]WSB79589.1 hypothetical protein OHB04_30265 [Streptomyces sp. NBC_01775]WSS12210.1 hypothetical protein OG533_09955 [Streptomyces sp. NBC_01186]WSS40921.1 hypothetical protein OG220_10105 [Streptomyces sp. NBC_01187]
MDVEQAEAALVEHYARLVRLAYLVLPPRLGRHRRVLAAHALTQRALPHGRVSTSQLPIPGPRTGVPGWVRPDPAYVWLRLCVLRAALAAQRPRRLGPCRLRALPLLPGLLPWVLGLRLFPRVAGADELTLDHALSRVSAAGRAAYVLRGLEGLAEPDIRRLLRELRVPDPEGALAEANALETPAGSKDGSLLESGEFDACALHARPTDLLRRRQHKRAALAAGFAVLACLGLLGAPGDSWGPDSAARPPYARNAEAQRALDPGALTRVRPGAWRRASRADFSAWPARGPLRRDEALLERALATWAHPAGDVRVSAVRGTPAGPPAGPPQLLYAGRLEGMAVVLLHDGLRVARYAEPLDRGETEEVGVALDLARTAGAGATSSGALVISRTEGEVRYLTAPWVRTAAVVDLLDPADKGSRELARDRDGVTARMRTPVTNPRRCESWPGVALTGSEEIAPEVELYTDLGELPPARLTDGKKRGPATSEAARTRLARTACHFPAVLAGGVKSVNSWEFARQRLPEGDGEAAWVCTRAGTWRGTGARAIAQFQAPARSPGRPGAAASRAENTPACGPRGRAVVTGVLWKSSEGHWYVLAASSYEVSRVRVRGTGLRPGAGGSAAVGSGTLAVPAGPGARAELSGEREDGSRVAPLR